MSGPFSEEDAYTYLSNAGFAPHQAAGIVGNLFQESNLNPNAVNPKSGAYGMAQYLGPRKVALHKFAADSGRDASDPRTQLDFMVSELQGPESRAMDHLLQTKTPEEAAASFSHRYERAGVAERNDARRTSKARQVLDHMMEKYGMPVLDAIVPEARAEEPATPEWFQEHSGEQEPGLPSWFKEVAPVRSASDEPSGLNPGSLREGVGLNLDSKVIGAQQIGSDIGRAVSGEIGQPYSSYRQDVNQRGRELEAKTKDMAPLTSAGYHGTDMLLYGATPVPEARAARIAANAAVPAALNALRPYEDGGERIGDSIKIGATGAILPEMLPYAFKGAQRLGAGVGGGMDVVRGIVDPRKGAQRELRREIGKEGFDLPASFGKSIHNPPPEYPGPILPEFGRVPGIKPTVGMLTDDPALLSLEMNARNRSSADFLQRDIDNKKAIVEGLIKRGYNREQADRLVTQLNESTGKMREAAYKKIVRSGALDEMNAPLEIVLNKVKTGEGSRASEKSQTLVRAVEDALGRTEGNPQPADLYQIRKDLNDALARKGQSSDKFDNAAKGQRRTVKQLTNAIDAGMQKASEGEWMNYLQAHRRGMQDIEGKRALGNIVADFEGRNNILPGGEGYPDITPAKLRQLNQNLTYQELGSRLEDKLGPHDRGFLTDAIDTMNAMERAKKGSVAINGSPTGTFISELMKSGLVPGSGKIATAINFADALGRSRGARYLDEALLDPEKFQELLSATQGGKGGLTGMLMKRSLDKVPESIKRAGVEIGRRATRQPSRD